MIIVHLFKNCFHIDKCTDVDQFTQLPGHISKIRSEPKCPTFSGFHLMRDQKKNNNTYKGTVEINLSQITFSRCVL